MRSSSRRWTAARWLIAGPISLACGAPGAPREWVELQRGELVPSVDVRGKLEASVSDSLGPPIVKNTWEFKIARLVPEGSSVSQGDIVMSFDATELERQLLEKRNERDAARASIEKRISELALARKNDELAIAEAEARLRKATLKLARPGDLTGSLEQELARLDSELAETELAHRKRRMLALQAAGAADIEGLRGRLERAGERLASLELDIPRMKVVAPRAGTVVYIAPPNGPKKQVGDGVWWGERILKIAVLEQMQANGEIDEVDISQVEPGLEVSFRLEAHPDVECRGTLTSVGGTVERASADNPARIIHVDIDVTETAGLRPSPGMRFEGRIETERLVDRLLIPISAVFPGQRGPVAHRKSGTGFETVELDLGLRDRDQVEVLAGLEPGDAVSRSDLARIESEER